MTYANPDLPVRSRYSTVAIWLHWIIALLLIGNLVGGLTMDHWLDSPDPAQKAIGFVIIGLHKAVGLTVLALSLARLAWRLGNPPPPLPGHMTPIERVLAKVTHWGFYALMLLLPLSGWAMASTGKRVSPISWFGLFNVPPLPIDRAFNGVFHESHEVLGYVAIATIVLHVLAALKHQYFDRDSLLARMWPSGGRG